MITIIINGVEVTMSLRVWMHMPTDKWDIGPLRNQYRNVKGKIKIDAR